MARLAIVLALLAAPALGDVSGRMRSVFDDLGSYASVNGPAYVSAQTRHVFSGGGISYRAPRETYQLFSATGPSLRAGCGGIDLYSGSFSFINKDQFVNMLNNIAANSVGLAFKTALCSTSANLCQAIEDLQRTISQLNRFNIDSCEAAKSVVGGFMGAAAQSSQAACQSSAWLSGIGDDASEARAMCSVDSDFRRARSSAAFSNEEVNKPIEFVGGNLTWQALAEVAGGIDVQEREFLQSMLGTHVVATVSLELRYYPPTITSLSDLNEREITLLSCDDPADCLRVTSTPVTLDSSFIELTRGRLADIRANLLSGAALTDEQLGLVAGAPLPVLEIIQADAAGAVGLADIAAEAIAYATAYHFLTSSLREAANSASAWKSRSANEEQILRSMVDGSRELRSDLALELHASLSRVNDIVSVGGKVGDLRRRISSDTFAPLTSR